MTDNFFLGANFDSASVEPINFIETRFHDLSPFSAHEIEIEGVVYKTAEHAYHALRTQPRSRSKIIAARSPLDAWRLAQQFKQEDKLLPNYDKDALMERIFRAKLAQHPDIGKVLRASGNRQLHKVFDADYYWGTGADGSGQNKMGKLWMKV